MLRTIKSKTKDGIIRLILPKVLDIKKITDREYEIYFKEAM